MKSKRFVRLKDIIGLCSVVATERPPHSVYLSVQLKRGGENGFMTLDVRVPGERTLSIITRQDARHHRDRVLCAMNAGLGVWVQTGDGGDLDDWEPLYATRDFGWQPLLPSKLRVRAKRITES